MMKDDPKLNHTSNVATYGQAEAMPDPIILKELGCETFAATLDVL
jgi:hypothetical protein